MAFFADLVRCEVRLYNQFNDELRAAHGIVTSQLDFMRFIRDHDSPRTTDMAAEFAIGVGAVSKGMDRLEAHGLITRLPNPANRRSSILALTDEGLALVDAAEASFETRLVQILSAAASPSDLAATASVLARLRADLERDGLGTPVG
ncbi:MarR family winged helix-turn-helix transcriptional regulator [Frondihabitans sp. PAMC 28766]|uniref:MarR family winged helix-turn-helix transcriptional regulator n=1 Tax=Frondihabitans sp. PAMC 28766 TaxID=1795630 RepID=UPI001EF66390|nr:MarR family transcriptional regulator [Frondihabitans sp. PAMC 28766]